MRKIAVLLIFCTIFFSSCVKKEPYIPPCGEYLLKCQIGETEYTLNVTLNEDMSAKMTFDEGSPLCDWVFTYDGDNVLKNTSLTEASEEKSEYVKMIFDFVTGDYENISDVSAEMISGRNVSVLTFLHGEKIYTDSESGHPMRLVYKNMTVDVLSRPSTAGI